MSLISPRLWALHQTFRGIWRAKTVFLMALCLAALALTIPTFLGVLSWSLAKPLLSVSVAAEITVFTDRSAGPASVKKLAEKIAEIPIVDGTSVIGRKDALEMINASLGIKPGKNASNPLPDIIVARISPRFTREEISDAAARMQSMEGVDSIAYDDQWSVHFSALMSAASLLLAMLGAIVFALVLLVIGASVRMTTSAQREEMRALYLFGATDGFIERPYVWRGFLTLGLAAGASLALTHFALQTVAAPLTAFLALYETHVDLAMPSPGWCALYALGAAFAGGFIGKGVAGHAVRAVKRA